MADESTGPLPVLRELVNGYRVSQAIRVAAVLGIADLLAGGARTSEDLAANTAAHPDALYRLLRALAAVGVFHEEEGHRFSLTAIGNCMRRDVPESLYGWIMFDAAPTHWRNWGDLEYGVRTGENAFRHLFGTDSWTYRQDHPELSEDFDLAMSTLANLAIASLLPIFDFGRFTTIVDVGGGNGVLLAAILAKYPFVGGVLFDQPHVVARSEPVLAQAGVADRCYVVGGDFFKEIPSNGDAYVLKSIIHDWEDKEAIAILRNCRQAKPEGAALLAIERDLGSPNALPESKFSDLNMLLGPGGRERTVEEYAGLFDATGFQYVGFTAGSTEFGIFEGVAI